MTIETQYNVGDTITTPDGPMVVEAITIRAWKGGHQITYWSHSRESAGKPGLPDRMCNEEHVK